MRRIRIGMLGCGTVGGGLVRLLTREHDRIRARYGIDIEIGRILVRDVEKERGGLPMHTLRARLTDCALDVLDSDCELIVEVVGGVHTAGALVRRAIARGRNVVTANKALLASAGSELFAAASRSGVGIGFEASVCGGVPVVGALRRGLSGDSVQSITGVLNGTSNYVLCRMAEGQTLMEATRCAQAAGFAEADPALDLSGEDAAQKLSILAHVAFAAPVRRRVVCGLEELTVEQVAEAGRAGQTVRQIAEARLVAGRVEISVSTRRIAGNHPFARLVDEQNAVLIRSRASGEIWMSGKGAGSMPTAAAVLSDVISL